MSEATSITLRMIRNDGDYTLYELKATVTDGETITIPTRHTQITTATRVQVVGSNNIEDGTDSGVVSVVYDDGNRQFTVTDTGAADSDVRIMFYADKT